MRKERKQNAAEVSENPHSSKHQQGEKAVGVAGVL